MTKVTSIYFRPASLDGDANFPRKELVENEGDWFEHFSMPEMATPALPLG